MHFIFHLALIHWYYFDIKMVRSYCRKSHIAAYSEENLKHAVNDVNNEVLCSPRKAPATYEILESTIERHIKGQVSNPGQKIGHFKVAQPEELEENFFSGLGINDACKLAFVFAEANDIIVPFNKSNKKAKKDWLVIWCFFVLPQAAILDVLGRIAPPVYTPHPGPPPPVNTTFVKVPCQ